MIDELIEYFFGSKKENKANAPESFCPNCWGTQEYDNKIRELYKDKQIDVNNHEAQHAFIQNFVVEQIKGIHLKKGNSGLECPTCHAKYNK